MIYSIPPMIICYVFLERKNAFTLMFAKSNYITNTIKFQFLIGLGLELNWT